MSKFELVNYASGCSCGADCKCVFKLNANVLPKINVHAVALWLTNDGMTENTSN